MWLCPVITVSSDKRFVIFGASYVVEERSITNVSIVDYPETIYVDDVITAEDVLINVTYDKGAADEGIHPDTAVLDKSEVGTKVIF